MKIRLQRHFFGVCSFCVHVFFLPDRPDQIPGEAHERRCGLGSQSLVCGGEANMIWTRISALGDGGLFAACDYTCRKGKNADERSVYNVHLVALSA